MNITQKSSNIRKPSPALCEKDYDQVGFISGRQVWINILKSLNVIYHIDRIKRKTHVILPIDAEKEFDKVPHPIVIQIQEIRCRKELQLYKGHIRKTYTRI